MGRASRPSFVIPTKVGIHEITRSVIPTKVGIHFLLPQRPWRLSGESLFVCPLCPGFLCGEKTNAKRTRSTRRKTQNVNTKKDKESEREERERLEEKKEYVIYHG